MDPTPIAPRRSLPTIPPGLVQSLTDVYAALLKRQRTAASAFIRWSLPTKHSQEFTWLKEATETLFSTGKPIAIRKTHPNYDQLQRIMATHALNPYEKEVYLGYPYVLGNHKGTVLRAPLFTMPVTIQADGASLVITGKEDSIRFNSLPYRSDEDTALFEQSLDRLIDTVPPLPLTSQALQHFCDAVARELQFTVHASLDGRLTTPPSAPITEPPIDIYDLVGIFIAPKTNYFLTKDLEDIGKQSDDIVAGTALGALIGTRDSRPTSNLFTDSRQVYFPFSSNANQRRAALLARESDVTILNIYGPPGTGKTLTMGNIACDLIANGKRVLITSQKDKALEMVDELLRTLDLPQLPMTLLRQDRSSKEELRQRLDAIQKSKSSEETARARQKHATHHTQTVSSTTHTYDALSESLLAEHRIEQAVRALNQSKGILKRLSSQWTLWEARRLAKHRARLLSDELGDTARAQRTSLLRSALQVLESAAEHRTSEATRTERNQLREFSKLLSRNQQSFRNFPVFDRMKTDPGKCDMLLKILPCWIMTPDDAARLLPCAPGLFDTVLIDEASQADLASMAPILYRAKQLICCGDSQQMKASRFSFTSGQINTQAWRQHRMDQFDPDRWLDPTKIDLLQLCTIRADEEVMLTEHYRSLPSLISFSNDKWYGGQLRLMRDHDDRRHGDPDHPTIRLYHVPEGRVAEGSQENPREAEALLEALTAMLAHPAYAEASIGILCLYEQQAQLLNEMVQTRIDEAARLKHDLIVSNPDGVQGDERDIILFSLSYDAQGMTQAQLSARQSDRDHVQGMLNVAFTRAREEIHVFHSAPIDEFAMASGRGTLRDWLAYCAEIQQGARPNGIRTAPRADSEFEAQVSQALQAKGLRTIAQFPSCGYYIDLVAEKDDQRLAIECDGEIYHTDESGNLTAEDCYRQEVLERGGWRLLRIPYRGWIAQPDFHITRVLQALQESDTSENPQEDKPATSSKLNALTVTKYEHAIIEALRTDVHILDDVLRAGRTQLGLSRLSATTKQALTAAIDTLKRKRIVVIEEDEIFLSEPAKTAPLRQIFTPPPTTTRRPFRRYRPYRRY